MSIDLFDKSGLNNVPWPDTAYGGYARRYLTPMIHDTRRYIKNVYSPLFVALVDDVPIPFSLALSHPQSSYVAAPFNHYISYGIEELAELGQPVLESCLAVLLRLIGQLCRFGELDQTVLVNNWYLSTNLYPPLEDDQIERLHKRLLAEYPNRTLIWRSVDDLGGQNLMHALLKLGYRPVFSRRIWYQDPASPDAQRQRNYRRDMRHLQRTKYLLVSHGSFDPNTVIRLYNQLYIEKYSRFNPQFTADFIRLAQEESLLTFYGFEKEGVLEGVSGYLLSDRFITCPILGYDLNRPQQAGLYRLLTSQSSVEALRLGKMVHRSSGVGQFKRSRGAVGALEYNMVYDRHLPAYRRRPWQLLQTISDNLAIPVIIRRGF